MPYVNHYSFHILDPDWGHLTVKISGHPPFPAQVILNGHEYVACRARKAGISFTKQGNCFTTISDAAALAKIADTLSEPRAIYARLDTPMFVMYGGRDEIVPRAPIRRFVDGLPAEPMRRRKLAWDENGYHRLLRDLQAPVVIADVASWVLIPAAPLPSGADRTAAEAFLPADGRLSLAGR